MDTNVQALKGLYAALNGDPKDVENMDTSSEVITAMQDVAAAAATELPVVAKKDAGKVLTVNGNGKWSAAMPETEIDDTEASETKTYSSSKIVSLIPANELPTPSVSNSGKVATVVSDGEGGYEWGAEMPSKFHVVTGEYNEGTGKFIIDASSQEKNVTDIINHITNGEPVFCIVRTGNSKYIFDVLVATNNKIAFSGIYVASGTAYFYYTGAIEGDFPTLDIPSQVNMTVKELALT